MSALQNVIWLASYPKSGNTWFRAFITALLQPHCPEIDINNLYPSAIASSRSLFDEVTGVASSDLSFGEIDSLRPSVYRQNAREAGRHIFHKVHDSWQLLPTGEALFPPDITLAVLYFIRNPLDVAVSFANHLHTTTDKAIDIMENAGYAFCHRNDRLYNQFRQKLGTWSGHVTSWVDESKLPVMVVRYEDMLSNPMVTFSAATRFVKLDADEEQVRLAIERCSFSRLKKQESERGFNEKNIHSPSFFRKGVAGDWRNELSPAQVQRIVKVHGPLMERFGYTEPM